MLTSLEQRWLGLAQGFWFVPGTIVLAHAALAVGLVQLDESVSLSRSDLIFQGDDSAARSVLSTVAGSLITVAGLTFSLTVLTLQLTSSQFSPRVLRNFVSDRVVQLTAGSFVGIFVYSLLVLRSVGDIGPESGFVPRLSITVAVALGILAAVLLLVFIHHITRLIQASNIVAGVGRETLRGIDRVYPKRHGEAGEENGAHLLEKWYGEAEPGLVYPSRPGYVQLVALDRLVDALGDGPPRRLHVTVCPGDFVSLDAPIAAIWPAEGDERSTSAVRRAVAVASERDFEQDTHFGIRQLTDIALKGMSPSINDPTTAVTCVGYMRSALVRLAARAFPSEVRRYPEQDVTAVVRRREFGEYLDAFLEIGRYAEGDARLVASLLEALAAIASAAAEAGARERARAAGAAAETIATQAIDEAKGQRDRDTVRRLLGRVETMVGDSRGAPE